MDAPVLARLAIQWCAEHDIFLIGLYLGTADCRTKISSTVTVSGCKDRVYAILEVFTKGQVSCAKMDMLKMLNISGTDVRIVTISSISTNRGTPWVSGLVGHFVQTLPDSECSHTVQCLDCSD